jgi:ATP synthase protein I
MNEDPGRSGLSFEERLRAARQRQGLDPHLQPPEKGSGGWGQSPMGIGLRVGLELVCAMLVACAIGWGIDRLLGTKPIFLVAFVPLGGAAGVLNLWRMFAPRQDSGRKRE